jgi:hypothetical protein
MALSGSQLTRIGAALSGVAAKLTITAKAETIVAAVVRAAGGSSDQAPIKRRPGREPPRRYPKKYSEQPWSPARETEAGTESIRRDSVKPSALLTPSKEIQVPREYGLDEISAAVRGVLEIPRREIDAKQAEASERRAVETRRIKKLRQEDDEILMLLAAS